MQIDNKFTAFFIDSTTAPWTPIEGLSATITIRESNAPYTVVVNDEAMIEMGGWHYIYTFSGMSTEKDYVYTCDPNSSLAFIESWVTDKRINSLDRNISDIVSWGWLRSKVNLSGVTTSINNLSKKIDALSEKEIDFTDLYGKIDDAISKIESIEIPEFNYEEKEAKKAVKLLNSVAKELKTYIESQNKKEDEIMAITSELNKLDIEDAMEQKQKEMEHKKEMERKQKEEEEENKKIIELLNAEFDKLEEEDRMEKKKELEEELKEKEKEMKEIQKELKSL